MTQKESYNASSAIRVDAVVIGTGAAGLCAALAARERGIKVAILEKMPFPGGTSLFAEGMFAVESSLQADGQIKLSRAEGFKNHMRNTYWRANARLVRDFIDQSSRYIDWLRNLGVEFTEVTSLWPGGPRTWHIIQGGGRALVQTLMEKVKERGIHVFLETALTKIVTDSQNHIAGVLAANKEGMEIEIKSRGVIIAGGGFSSNPDMIDRCTQLGPGIRPVIDLKQTGEPIQLAWEIGAIPHNTDVVLAIPYMVGERPDSHLWAAAVQPHLWINQQGERFCDETIYFQFPFSANALANQPGGTMYCICDEQQKRRMVEEGVPIGLGVFVRPHSKLDKLDGEIHRGIDEHKVFTAASVTELAGKIGLKSEMLQSSLDAYNRCCQQQHDDLFAKDSKYLNPIQTGKLYAFKVSYHLFTTLGGIKINHRTEVLKTQNQIIPGLYAAGNCASGMYGGDYDIFTSGGALGFAVYSGLTSGKHCSEFIGK